MGFLGSCCSQIFWTKISSALFSNCWTITLCTYRANQHLEFEEYTNQCIVKRCNHFQWNQLQCNAMCASWWLLIKFKCHYTFPVVPIWPLSMPLILLAAVELCSVCGENMHHKKVGPIHLCEWNGQNQTWSGKSVSQWKVKVTVEPSLYQPGSFHPNPTERGWYRLSGTKDL